MEKKRKEQDKAKETQVNTEKQNRSTKQHEAEAAAPEISKSVEGREEEEQSIPNGTRARPALGPIGSRGEPQRCCTSVSLHTAVPLPSRTGYDSI